MKLRMLKGIPGSGKSTFARKLVAESGNSGRINRDDLRSMIYDGHWTQKRESVIVDCEKAIAKVLLENNQNPIIDDTNLTQRHHDMWSDFSRRNDAEFSADFIDTPYEICLNRNIDREKEVPEPVIARMAIQAGIVKFRDDEEIILCDVDGTIADGSHRQNLVTGDKKDWTAYFSKLSDDTPVEFVIRWMQEEHKAGRTIIVVSGRPDTYWKETKAWLIKHKVPFRHLLMRRGTDKREDVLIKKEILEILPKENIIFSVDDRPSVCRMWKSAGLRVVKVRGEIEDF